MQNGQPSFSVLVVTLGLPQMGMTIWTIGVCPMHLTLAVWGDLDTAQVSVFSMVPLLLQLWTEPADVWTLLLIGLPTDEMSVLDGCAHTNRRRDSFAAVHHKLKLKVKG